jgi:hypothetical protein
MNLSPWLIFGFQLLLQKSFAHQAAPNDVQEAETHYPFLESVLNLVFNDTVEIGVHRIFMLMSPIVIVTNVATLSSSLRRYHMNALNFGLFDDSAFDARDIGPPIDPSSLWCLMLISAIANFLLGSTYIDKASIRSHMTLVLSSAQLAVVLWSAVYDLSSLSHLDTVFFAEIGHQSTFICSFFITMLVLYPYIMMSLENEEEFA